MAIAGLVAFIVATGMMTMPARAAALSTACTELNADWGGAGRTLDTSTLLVGTFHNVPEDYSGFSVGEKISWTVSGQVTSNISGLSYINYYAGDYYNVEYYDSSYGPGPYATAGSYTFDGTISDFSLDIGINYQGGLDVASVSMVATCSPAAPASTDVTLSALSLSSGTLSPSFAASTVSYTASVPNTTTSITVTPTVTDANATVTVNNVPVTSGTASGSISLSVGTNTITTVVTAEDGSTTKTYTVVVTRAAPASTDATLSALSLSSGILSPSFAASTV
ncbi:hypothetical protein J2858_003057, partial [Neorhizobium galegae]|nr:hypothetical protein [Neorhizobium galegae]